jgi:two-component system chemotaxis sensor kinase CheA
MSFDPDEEILNDFLIEAGEILEKLSEQLVDLEQRPDDIELLNAIFRGFHTVKGGAGFLQLDALVELCHVAENVFDLLRNRKLSVNSDLMDVVLRALDAINVMFSNVKARNPIELAPESLKSALHSLVQSGNGELVNNASVKGASEHGQTTDSKTKTPDEISDDQVSALLLALKSEAEEGADTGYEENSDVNPNVNNNASPSTDNNDDDLFGFSDDKADVTDQINDDEFKEILSLTTNAQSPVSAPTEKTETKSGATHSDDLITDDEFEQLLDTLHGKKSERHNDKIDKNSTPVKTIKSDLITDDEFDSLLDDLYGKGKSPVPVKTQSNVAKEVSEPVASKVIESKQTSKLESANSMNSQSKKMPSLAAPANDEELQAAPVALSQSSSEPSQAISNSAPKEVPAETTVRVDTKRLDDIMNMVGELVLVRNRLMRLGLASSSEEMQKAVANLDVVTGDIQMAVMKTRMQPIKKVFGRFPRVVRDMARNLKKEINLDLEGEETDLDKNLVEALSDPLVHLVRNSVDHGIEMPSVRVLAGKPRIGKIVLSAQQEGDHIILSITDDGAGMDPDVLKAKAVEKGLLDEDAAARLSDSDAYNLIFYPGFSTKTEISDVSGRGVGMDVVKTKIAQLNGIVSIQSEIGVGTRIAIQVPLTLAIMPTLMVKLDKQSFALPLVSVNEIFNFDIKRTNVVDGQEVVIVRNKAIPLFYLKRWLVPSYEGALISNSPHVVVVTVGSIRVGLVVDKLIGQEEVVIKPLGKMLHGTMGMAGATITGDGSIAIILDVPGLIKRYA